MLRRIRLALAALSLLAMTLVFLDFTGTAAGWLGFLPKMQFLPALLGGSAVIALAITAATLLFGRIYCSVVCPLGIFQDLVLFCRRLVTKKPVPGPGSARVKTRWTVFAVFFAGGFLGLHFTWLAPYAIYARAAQAFVAPLGRLLDNALAERFVWCAARSADVARVVMPSAAALVFAGAMIALVAAFAAAKGRLWCNSVCPVGTLLSLFARFALFRVRIDAAKCAGCGMCARRCRAAAIDSAAKSVDATRCVDCFDCLETCRKGALAYRKK